MGAKRTTNKDILDRLDSLIDVLTAQAMPATPASQPKAENSGVETIEIDAAYLAHLKGKAEGHAKDKGSEVVLYSRKNKAGETKLAYALRERYDTQIVNQPSHIGAVATFSG